MDQAIKRGAEKQEEKGTFPIACMSPFLTICETCKRRFPALRSHAKTCSPRCKKARQRKHRAELARNEWYTPPNIVEAARAVMGGIDLDLASSPAANAIVQAERFFTIKDDGLKQPWAGRVWLNPPYGKQAPKFVVKFAAQHPNPVVAACLLLGTHHMTTKWFAPLAVFKPVMCLPNHRLHFSGSTTRPAHGSVILGFGVDPTQFRKAFACFGPVSTFA